jgi:hypothetical protein
MGKYPNAGNRVAAMERASEPPTSRDEKRSSRAMGRHSQYQPAAHLIQSCFERADTSASPVL